MCVSHTPPSVDVQTPHLEKRRILAEVGPVRRIGARVPAVLAGSCKDSQLRKEEPMKRPRSRMTLAAAIALGAFLVAGAGATTTSAANGKSGKTYDITTLAGKLASLNGTAGLQTRFSAFLQEEAADLSAPSPPPAAITPAFVLSSPLDGTSVLPPDVTTNQDTAAAPQNETSIAVDPNNPNRVVSSQN